MTKTFHWLDHLDKNNFNIELLTQACTFASLDKNAFTNGLAMADVLVALRCDSSVIAAAILYPSVLHHKTQIEKLNVHFDKGVCKLITGATQLDIIHRNTTEKLRTTGQQNQIDNLRKMMLAMVDDIRIVLIKLAERLIMLQNAHHQPPEKQKQIAQDTLDYYAPLANRLGIGYLKWQLEDWAFRYLNPVEFARISTALQMRREDRVRLVHEMVAALKSIVSKAGLKESKVSGRIKHIYSIYKKTQRKHLDVEHIYDTIAVRVLVRSIMDCYTTLSLVHEKWTSIPAEFDDYIAKPKHNGYQSIHTAILHRNKTPIEIQIRTVDMHEKAELGVAAHWKYKENKTVQDRDVQKINLLRELLDWQQDVNAAEMQQKIYRDAFHDRVYVFSPTHDVFDLPCGATPLDFAYLIHTEIGHRCRGAKINGALMPLTYVLQPGDHIEIVTGKEVHPSRDWIRVELGYLKTPHAISKVKNWFYKLDYEKNLAAGIALWEKISRQQQLQKSDLDEAMLVGLGAGDLIASAIVNKLKELEKEKKERLTDNKNTVELAITDHKTQPSSTDFTVQGISHLLTQLAQCCHPLPGDDVMGYITKGRGITVHQKKCRNIVIAKKLRPERLMEITWENQQDKKYRVNLEIQSEDRSGLLRDITGLLAQLNLSILAIQSRVSTDNNSAKILLTLEVKNIALLDDIIRKMRQVRGVAQVERK